MSTYITKTWFDGEKIVTQEIPESEVYKQEPAAWYDKHGMVTHDPFEGVTPLYKSPRQWVGLTDKEIKEIIGPWGDTPIKGYTRKLFDQIENKLKEKNT
jgi:hypothetical protein